MLNVVILTGAGVSAESGLGTFRDVGGMWDQFDLAEVATPEGFANDPSKVHHFYNMRRRDMTTAEPNAAHHALARLEAELARRGGAATIVTQNIDDLHERAGARNVIHMHGELLKTRCGACGAVMGWREDLSMGDGCRACGEIGALRPHVVWFGEIPFHMDEIVRRLSAADLFVSIGTSGAVYPANGFVAAARDGGIRTMELNLERSENAELFDVARQGLASVLVPAWVDEVLAHAA